MPELRKLVPAYTYISPSNISMNEHPMAECLKRRVTGCYSRTRPAPTPRTRRTKLSVPPFALSLGTPASNLPLTAPTCRRRGPREDRGGRC